MTLLKNRTLFRINFLFLCSIILFTGLSLIPLPKFLANNIDYWYQYLFILLPALLYLLFTKQNLKDTLSLKKVKFSYLLYTILLLILVFPITTLIGQLSTEIFGSNDVLDNIDDMFPTFFLSLFAIAITPAICEEFLFRGVLLDKKNNISIHHLAILIGVLFGIFHGNYQQMFYTIPLGIIMAYLTLISGSIFPAVLLHFLNNGFSVVMGEISSIIAEEPAVTDTATSLSTYLIWGAVAFICTIFIIKIIKKLLRKTDQQLCLESKDQMSYKLLLIDYSPAIIALLLTIGLNAL